MHVQVLKYLDVSSTGLRGRGMAVMSSSLYHNSALEVSGVSTN